MEVTIALVQFTVRINEGFNKLIKRVERFIQLASKQGSQIICFPEDFCFGPFDYYEKKTIDKLTTIAYSKVINWLSKQAKKYQINIIAGTVIRKVDNRLFNTCFVINKKGEIILRYDKQKLVPYGFENEKIEKGKRNSRIIELAGIKIGVVICRELFYPDFFTRLRKQGVEIVFVPSFWSKRSSDYQQHKLNNQYNFLSEMRVVDALCQARSFENEIVLCFVNACGNLKNGSNFDVLLGRSQICLPFFGCVRKLNKNREGVIFFNYKKSIINDARCAYKLF